ncbi:Lrp/AsnC family transcriptional regulator [Marinomonas profundimaris]|jgi:Lrp/AsnC family transcriptional regulator|uniref:AsnC family transcriptional regulator n=1 Tax=Marinomonas profundimaris TaxID=1208321 RepID=W1RQ58_9GAMM|nr:Lrp/AsnC family transcriptional regulator [Marinomonas profundimaris]ETI59161.1 AsnC family transcriptional regulator [Marinomonas profundimaris]
MEHLDSTDRKILQLLQHDGSLSATQVADNIGLSQSPCWRRINRLQQEGFIRSTQAILDRNKLGLGIVVLVNIKLSSHGRKMLDEFEQAIVDFPEVVECWTISGAMDYSLRVVSKSIESYEHFLRSQLLQLPHIQEAQSHFTMREVKNITTLPLDF